ncbi:MAG: Na+/H+ antiporter subunit B [Planctomycetota bacterium]
MNSVIFRSSTIVLLPFMLVLSIVVLLRGHNEPGGGFVGGLLAASGFALHAMAFGHVSARKTLRIDPRVLIGLGLIIATISGLPAAFMGKAYLKGLWVELNAPGFPDPLKVGTPLAFDIGVYLLVLGAAFLMIVTLEEYRHDANTGS